MVEPNPHFVEYFDINRAKYPGLDIKDMTQVGIVHWLGNRKCSQCRLVLMFKFDVLSNPSLMIDQNIFSRELGKISSQLGLLTVQWMPW